MPSIPSSALRRRLLAGSLLAAAARPFAALASESWPARPVRFVVPFPPGGPIDTTARIFSQKLGELWKTPAVIDNRAGAGGVVGAASAAREVADGHALFVASIHHAVTPSLMGRLPYDIEKDFAPVSFAAMFPVFVVAHPSVPAGSIGELIALAKKDGSAPAMNDLLGGQVQLMFCDAPTALQHIRTGRVKVLGVASRRRSAMLPEVPTVAESGLPGYEAYSWAALFAPARTPPAVLARINADFNTAMNDASVRQRLLEAGAEADPGTPEQLRQRLRGEMAKWSKVVRAAGITAG
ncbi:MAG: tripartite tricarboxylate transporter substrate-binding protein [Xenophilus sp.]